MFQTSESCIKLHAVDVLELLLSEQCVCLCVCVCVCPLLQVCTHLDGSNAENKISLLVILCIIMYVTQKQKNNNEKTKFKTDFLFIFLNDN